MKTPRTLSFWWQRRTRGWDDSDTWSLDATLARWLTPRLKRLREIDAGVMPWVAGSHPSTLAHHEWLGILDKMIVTFEWCADERHIGDPDPPFLQEGLDLFAKHFRDLWW